MQACDVIDARPFFFQPHRRFSCSVAERCRHQTSTKCPVRRPGAASGRSAIYRNIKRQGGGAQDYNNAQERTGAEGQNHADDHASAIARLRAFGYVAASVEELRAPLPHPADILSA